MYLILALLCGPNDEVERVGFCGVKLSKLQSDKGPKFRTGRTADPLCTFG